MPHLSTIAAKQLVKAMRIKQRLEKTAASDEDPEQLSRLVAKLRRTDRPQPSRRLRRKWSIETLEVAGHPMHLLTSRNESERHVILYLHGGGYMFGPFPTDWAACSRIAEATGYGFALYVYPKTPEHQARETVDAATQAYSTLEERYGADNVVIMGTSAGGALTLVLLAQLRDAGRPNPRAAVLISPGVDMTLSEPVDHLADRDVLLSVAHVRSAGRLYAGNLGADHPFVSPTNADLSGLPRLQVFAATDEILYPSLITFVERARAAGADVEMVVGEGQQHTWPLVPTADGRQAIRQIIDFIGAT